MSKQENSNLSNTFNVEKHLLMCVLWYCANGHVIIRMSFGSRKEVMGPFWQNDSLPVTSMHDRVQFSPFPLSSFDTTTF